MKDEGILRDIVGSLPIAASVIDGQEMVAVNGLFTLLVGTRSKDLPLPLSQALGQYAESILPLIKKTDGTSTYSVDLCTNHTSTPPGVFSLRFEISTLDRNRDSLMLLTVQESSPEKIIENIPIAAFCAVFGNAPAIRFITPSIRDITGFSQGDFYQGLKTVFSMVHPEDKIYAQGTLEDFFYKGHDLDVTFRAVPKKGGIRWTHWKGGIKTTNRGEEFLLGTIEDVTERKETELALLDVYERTRIIMEKVPVGIGLCDKTGVVIECNPHLARILGIRPQQVIGLNVLSAQNPVLRGMTRMTLRGKNARYTGPYQSEITGKRSYISAVGVPVKDESGHITGAIALVEDIEERRSLELALKKERDFTRAVLESANVMVLITDSTGKIKKVNRVVTECTGYSESHLLGKTIWSMLAGKRHDTSLKKAFEVAITFDRSGPVETECLTRHGNVRYISWTLTSLLDQETSLEAIVWTGIDITSNKELEDKLLEAQKMEAIGQLAGGVAHEFNNALMAITGQCEIIKMGLDKKDPLNTKIEAIEKAAQRAADITKKLLVFSGKAVLNLVPTELNSLINEIIEILLHISGEGIEVVKEFYPESIYARIDKDIFSQAFTNIFMNAVDAVDGKGRIIVETGKKSISREDSRHNHLGIGDYVFFKVKDTGKGMNKEVLERAVEPFFTTKPFGGGTGLGLSMAHGAANRFGGKIFLNSTEGQGTEVTFFLPEAHPQEKSPHNNSSVADHSATPTEIFDLTVLLVDDDHVVRKTLMETLRQMGATVVEAESGEKALELFEHDPFLKVDLVITDLAMPGMTGKETVEKIRGFCPDTPAIIVSGFPIIKGMDGHWPKGAVHLKRPFNMDTFKDTIRRVLQKKT